MSESDRPACGCGGETREAAFRNPSGWTSGEIPSAAGPVPVVATRLRSRDRLDILGLRLGIGRRSSRIRPGLYAVGRPDAGSPVFVTANYKFSFDRLREALDGVSGWLLVLDTKGINVWCAAGKGTFSAFEIARRIEATGLAGVVSHRRLILPQLAAPGVAAHDVAAWTGFQIVYGPVRARDIRPFLAAGLEATPGMRRVRFRFVDRLVLIPMELIPGLRYALPPVLILGLLSALGLVQGAGDAALWLAGALAVGTVATPLLLPWIPGRAFSLKGALLGLAGAVGLIAARGFLDAGATGLLQAAAVLLGLPAFSAFLAVNFTGATTFTSMSGVKRELRYALPATIAAAALGLVFQVWRFLAA